MISCPSCAKVNRPNSRFCNVCGWRLDFVIRCSVCGSTNVGDAVFCNECGQPFDVVSPSSALTAAATVVTGPATAPLRFAAVGAETVRQAPTPPAEVAPPSVIAPTSTPRSPNVIAAPPAFGGPAPEQTGTTTVEPVVVREDSAPAPAESNAAEREATTAAPGPIVDEPASQASAPESIAPVDVVAPTEPVESLMPAEPVVPVEVVAPAEPTAPVEVVAPVEPTGPVEPIAQAEPTAPVEFVATMEPVATVEPTAPVTGDILAAAVDPKVLPQPTSELPATFEPTWPAPDSTPLPQANQPLSGFDWSAISDLEAISPTPPAPPSDLSARPTERDSVRPDFAARPVATRTNGTTTLTLPAVGAPTPSWLDLPAADRASAATAPTAEVAPTPAVVAEATEPAEAGIVLARSFSSGRPTIVAAAAAPSLEAEAGAIATAATTSVLPAARNGRRLFLPEWLVIVVLIIIIAIAFALSLRAGVLDLASAVPAGVGGIAAAGLVAAIRTPLS